MAATVVQQTLRIQLQSQLTNGKDAARIAEEVRQSLDYIKTLEPEIQEIVKNCYVVAIRAGLGVMLGINSFSALSSCEFSLPSSFFRTQLGEEMLIFGWFSVR